MLTLISWLLPLQCFVCKQGFLCTAAEVKLREHSDNKHPKNTFLVSEGIAYMVRSSWTNTSHTDSR